MTNVTFPIFVTQTYTNQALGRDTSSKRGGSKGKGRTKTKSDIEGGGNAASDEAAQGEESEGSMAATTAVVTQAVQMRNFRWRNFSGTINSLHPGDGSCVPPSCWYYDGLPADLRHTEAVVMQCAATTAGGTSACRDFELSGIDLKPEGGAKTSAVCENVPREHNPRLGFVCATGEFRAV
jgi:hypothetical protein